ncbi:enhancer of polycomb homolog 1 [Diachasma alloeum]|uniref:enhancer of polycomb homolog 1 n=1 Tax=Diachasma alloeum TaxID=454923 RepID=UPI00073819EE|nr:enhancer of polycomb homolog 1 [Diachasma alloeum]XP_015112814.1 enhancer of polycomb homolog 1 [Diachasma alloeum]
MSKLSFRARALDASKPMPIYMAEELPDLPDYSAINRAVPQMPSGMTKEEECEHHLQRAICAGLIIPTPEVTDLTDVEAYDKIYPADYKLPRQLIHMQPFAMEQDIPDYDMDSEDEKWVGVQSRKMDLTPLQFEEMMDRLEKSSGQNVVTLNEAKALLKEDDDLIIAVFDYWLNKRLKTQHPLLLTVKTDHRLGSAANNPYLAFRRITEKMQTRKNRKNDETSYEKMLKLRRDLSRAVTLLELVKRREKTKREHLHLTIEVYEKRYQAEDFNGQILSDVSALKTTRPAFAPLFTNQFGVHQNWANKLSNKEDGLPRKEKRQYKKRKHKVDGRAGGLDESGVRIGSGTGSSRSTRTSVIGSGLDPLASSDEDSPFPHTQMSMSSDRDEDDNTEDGLFAFRRNRYSTYLPPVSNGFGNWPWCEKTEGGAANKKYRFALTSISKPSPRCIGLARRRLGRGGRVILDRYSSSMDDIWSSLDFTIHESQHDIPVDPLVTAAGTTTTIKKEPLHFRPKTPECDYQPPDAPQNSSVVTNSSTEESDNDLEPDPRTTHQVYQFPQEATSICVDFEPERPGDESPFTTEFNVSDYFAVDTLSEFDLGLSSSINDDQYQFGSSRFHVTQLTDNVISCRGNQCSVSSATVNTNVPIVTTTCTPSLSLLSSSVSSAISSSITTSIANPSTSTVISSVMNSTHQHQFIDNGNYQQYKNQQRQSLSRSGNSSILSKSVVTGGARHSGNVDLTGITNFGNGHQNGPSSHLHGTSVTLQNSGGYSGHSQGALLLPQKHPTTGLLPGFIAPSKLASLARQQQHQVQQPGTIQGQQLTTSKDITLNSNNSEGMDMEVDGVEGSSCDTNSQQQQLVRTNKTNSLAMEVT